MSVKINKRGKKLYVNFEYNPVVIGICRKVACRFYNSETKDKITSKITKSGLNYHVKFDAFVDGF